MKLLEKHTDEEVDEMILETDADDTQCSEQIVDVPVPQIAERIVEVGTANPRTSRCTDRQRVRTHTKVMEKIVKDSSGKLRTHRMRRLSQDTIQQRTGEQVVNKHVQQVVNSVEVKQSKIIKNMGQRKNPVIHEKINQVSKQQGELDPEPAHLTS